MRRVGLAVILAVSLVFAPFAAEAQPAGKVWRIGVLTGTAREAPRVAPFLEGLRRLGYVEGQNINLEWRVSGGRAERFPDL